MNVPSILSESGYHEAVSDPEECIRITIDPLRENAVCPIICVSDRAERVSDFLEQAFVPHLQAEGSGEAVIFTPDHPEGLMAALSEALHALFPELSATDPEELLKAPWGLLVATLIRTASGDPHDRILVVDQADRIFEAPEEERNLFADSLCQIAREEQISVLIGVGQANLESWSQLPGLGYAAAEVPEPRPVQSDADELPDCDDVVPAGKHRLEVASPAPVELTSAAPEGASSEHEIEPVFIPALSQREQDYEPHPDMFDPVEHQEEEQPIKFRRKQVYATRSLHTWASALTTILIVTGLPLSMLWLREFSETANRSAKVDHSPYEVVSAQSSEAVEPNSFRTADEPSSGTSVRPATASQADRKLIPVSGVQSDKMTPEKVRALMKRVRNQRAAKPAAKPAAAGSVASSAAEP